MKVLKIIGKISFCLLCAISFVIGILNIHFVYFVENTTTGTNYIDDQSPVDIEEIKEAGKLSEEEILQYENRKLFEVNYYSNEADNGILLQEMKLNFFTDTTLTTATCRSTGMQSLVDMTELPSFADIYNSLTIDDMTKLYDLKGNRNSVLAKEVNIPDMVRETFVDDDNYIPEDFYYYDTTNMISWNGGYGLQTNLSRATDFIIKIDGEPYKIKLDGKKDFTFYPNFFASIFGLSETITTYYNYAFIFTDLMKAVETNSQGYGDFYIVVDLSRYFTTIQKINNGKWEDLPSVDIVKNYAVIKFHYDKNGATSSSQSLFGIIEGNANYGTISDSDADFWQERVVYTLSTKFLDYRYSEVYGGHFATIRQDIFNKLVKMPRAKVSFKINLSDEFLMDHKYKLIGFDYSAFEGVRVDTVSITGSGNFYILDNAFAKTSIQQIKHSKAVKLIVSESAFDSDWQEVVT